MSKQAQKRSPKKHKSSGQRVASKQYLESCGIEVNSQRVTTYKKAAARKPVELVGKTPMQEAYIKALGEASQVIVYGPAGTGKTYIAATKACNLYLTKTIDKIVISRPNVGAGATLGLFKGSLEEKMQEWVKPVFEVLVKHLGRGTVETGVKLGNIEVLPFETMRGRDFQDTFVILDEAQNTTPHEMKMFLTRIGNNCTVVLNGDIQQSDIKGSSGLATATNVAQKYNIPISIIEFSTDDIVRSALCKQWIIAFMEEGL